MDSVINLILTNPVVLGGLVQAAMKWAQGALSAVDKNGTLANYAPQLHIAFLILSFLASVANAGATGGLGSIDLTSVATFVTYWIQVIVGGKAMAVASPVAWQAAITRKK